MLGPTEKTYIQTGYRNESRGRFTSSDHRSNAAVEPIKEEVLETENTERKERVMETETYKSTMHLYGQHRGMTAREHATICLQVANSFKVHFDYLAQHFGCNNATDVQVVKLVSLNICIIFLKIVHVNDVV